MNPTLRFALDRFPSRRARLRQDGARIPGAFDEVRWGFYLLLAKIMTAPLQPSRLQPKAKTPR